MKMTRRDFLKTSAAAAAGVAVVGVLGACGNGGSSSSASGDAAATTAAADDMATTAAAEGGDAKVGATVFKCAFNQTLENPEAKTLLQLSDDLYDATEGRYSIEVYPSEQLGSQAETLELVQAGTIEMALVANSIIENVDSNFAMLGTPYVYDSEDHQQKVFESDVCDDIFASTAASGFETIAVYGLGARNLYTKELITTPEELSGKKIRVMQSDTMISMMNYMGGVGTPMPQGDVYTAIQTGTLDGAENNIITYTDLVQYEVAPFYTLTSHLMIPDELTIGENVLMGMSEEDQAALRKVAKDSITTGFELCKELRQSYFDKATGELGVTVTEVDIKPFQDNCAPLIDEIAARNDVTQGIYDAIRSFA